MALSSPSPPSSSTDSQSPSVAPSDLVLDPADPFNFLLNQSIDEPAQSMWPESDFSAQMKPYGAIDFTDLSSLSMDIDYMNAIAVEPSALQYNLNPHYGFDAHPTPYVDGLSSTQLAFPFQIHHDPSSPSDSSSMQSSSSSTGRRLSISSSVSSSLSPAPESMPSPAATKLLPSQPVVANPAPSDAAGLIAERVRQSAGVMLALPMTAQLQAFENQHENKAPTAIPKLPIPRLPRHMSQPASNSLSTSAASTPPPTTPSPPPTGATPPGAQPRSKTSHTTIERRYRTNLNARIQSLRMAVPALRVVDDRDSGKKRAPNKVLVSGDPLRSYTMGEDVVDERGFVDGVKVARKCSKANVLGKAVEYIRVLKKREVRLKNEQAGLKSLISGLVGGPALLREWEKEWKEMFGGEEKDEVEGEAELEVDDDDSEEEGDDDEEGGRKRKRGKTSPSSSPSVKLEKKDKKAALGPDGTVPEKRKRGRPRKVVPPPVLAPSAVPTEQTQQQQAQAPQQYLLATFALFSFFNSPLTSFSSSPTHVHTGTVLNGSGSGSAVPPAADTAGGWDISYCLQLFHLLVSIVVLVSCISSWTGVKLRPLLLGTPRSSSSILTALAPKHTAQKHPGESEPRTPADWVRLAESYIFSPQDQDPPIPLLSRVQVYHHISSQRGGASASDACTAALALHGYPGPLGALARAWARAAWRRQAQAQAHTQTRTGGAALYERLVLEEMSVDEAAAACARERDVGVEDATPMRVLGALVVRARVRAHLGVLFVAGVCGAGAGGGCEEVEHEQEHERELVERGRTVEAAKELGGAVGALGRGLERLWKVPNGEFVLGEAGEGAGAGDEGVAALVDAVVLFRRVFVGGVRGAVSASASASVLMSPPPSPGRREGGREWDGELGRLRSALGCRVFEESAVLEDARDRVVDMVVELERRNAGLMGV